MTAAMRIDLHVHTTASSPCSTMDPEAAIAAARAAGLDGICVTEHDEIAGASVACELGRELGFRVFRGIEIFTDMGDMLAYGLDRDAPSWKMPFDELKTWCEQAGALIVPAHSCRFPGELERLHGAAKVDRLMRSVDAIETHNGGCTPEGNGAALEIAARYGLPGIGGSDAHHFFQVGRCYTLFKDSIETDEALVAALREGACRGAYDAGGDALARGRVEGPAEGAGRAS